MLDKFLLKLNSKIIPFDLLSLGVFRAILGFALLYNLMFYRFPAVGVYYNNPSLIPECSGSDYFGPALPLFLWSDNNLWYYFLLGIIFILSLCFSIGYRTKWITPFLFFLYGSMITTNPYLVHGVEFLEETALFWSMFLPVGARFTPCKRDIYDKSKLTKFAHLGLHLQLFLIYFSSWIFKNGELWQSGKVLEVVSRDMIHARPILQLLGEYPLLAQISTYFGFYLEVLVSLLLLLAFFSKKYRFWTAVSILLTHAIMAVFLHVGAFFIIGLAFGCMILPEGLWGRFFHLKRKDNFDKLKTSLSLKNRISIILVIGAMLFILHGNLHHWSKNSYLTPVVSEIPFHNYIINRQLRDPGIFTGFWHQSWKFFPNNLYEDFGDFIFIGYEKNGTSRELRTGNTIKIRQEGNKTLIEPLPSHSYFGADFTFAVYYKFYQDRFPEKTKKEFLKLYLDRYNKHSSEKIERAELWKLIRSVQYKDDKLIISDSIIKQQTIYNYK